MVLPLEFGCVGAARSILPNGNAKSFYLNWLVEHHVALAIWVRVCVQFRAWPTPNQSMALDAIGLDAIGVDANGLERMFGFEKSIFDDIAVSASIFFGSPS